MTLLNKNNFLQRTYVAVFSFDGVQDFKEENVLRDVDDVPVAFVYSRTSHVDPSRTKDVVIYADFKCLDDGCIHPFYSTLSKKSDRTLWRSLENPEVTLIPNPYS